MLKDLILNKKNSINNNSLKIKFEWLPLARYRHFAQWCTKHDIAKLLGLYRILST